MKYQSWGRYPQREQRGTPVLDRHADIDFNAESSFLGYGKGRSYGDSCLNTEGTLLDSAYSDKFIEFDSLTGIIRCEPGATLKDIIAVALPKGWFLPVTPGTKFVTIGGAVANDVHGKNHHVDGTFGHFVRQLELLRSDGERLICSATSNADIFYATIGGLGLTGYITWVEIQLKAVHSAYVDVENICYQGLDEFKQLSLDSKDSHLYTVAWVDCMAKGADLGRGIFLRANHSHVKQTLPKQKSALKVPFNFPSIALNTFSIKAFNSVYYSNGKRSHGKTESAYYDPYFYPLDGIEDWNKIYGGRGFLQYQFVVPSEDYAVIKTIMAEISRSGAGSFLAVLKEFGAMPSLGLLSFPREGVCLALDFPFHGNKTLRLLERLDAMVRDAGGAVYPAKDARMSPESFKAFFPKYDEFLNYKDPKFSSDFWRRVMDK